PGEMVQVRNPAGDSIVTTSAAAELSFSTQKLTSYVLERVAKPLSGFAYGHIESNLGADGANHGVKHLSGTMSSLGL
ncbi:MAG TPA: hypothetical protein VL137_11735, partial [Polyangiaceae bacterium]|nr:hypothetical protein [Polyangiaceae bacterium]